MNHIGRIKVVKEDKDLMDCICICPHCGNRELYGNMFTISGIYGCPNCREELWDAICYDKAHHYNAYVRKANNHEYEPYRYMEDKQDD